MNEIISFQSWKHTILRDALDAAEAAVDRLAAEMVRLKRMDAPYSQQLQATMDLDRARQAFRKRERAFARFCGADLSDPEDEGADRRLAQVIALPR
jgi:hypothetical protein